MSGLTFQVDWISGDRVRAPELAATWASIRIIVNGDDVTVVQESDTNSYRSAIYASAYPLAEWIAFNWWRLITPGGGKPSPNRANGPRSLALRDAGDGFHWPDIYFSPNEELVDISARAESYPSERISYKIEGRWSVDRGEFERALRGFVESVSDRLNQSGVDDTPLQNEWQAIHDLESDSVEFCRAAAAIGEDPFDPDEDVADALLQASKEVASADLLVEMLAATTSDEALSGARWLGESERTMNILKPSTQQFNLIDLRASVPQRDLRLNRRYSDSPWVMGYQRARNLRSLMGLGSERVEMSPVAIARTDAHSPSFVEGLVGLEAESARLVVSSGRSTTSERFLQARSLYKSLYSNSRGLHVIANRNSVTDQIERAFAAEFLAPANGIAGSIGYDYSEHRIAEAASKYAVDVRVIEHQIENQVRT